MRWAALVLALLAATAVLAVAEDAQTAVAAQTAAAETEAVVTAEADADVDSEGEDESEEAEEAGEAEEDADAEAEAEEEEEEEEEQETALVEEQSTSPIPTKPKSLLIKPAVAAGNLVKPKPVDPATLPLGPSANNIDRNAPRVGAVDDYEEHFFAQNNGWTKLYDKYPWKQRYRLVAVPGAKTLIYSETALVVHADPLSIIDNLFERWDWWLHGRYQNRVIDKPNGITFELKPVYNGLDLKYKMFNPVKLANGSFRIRVEVSEDLSGVGYFLLEPQVDGSTIMYDRWSGIVKHHLGIKAESLIVGWLKGVSGTIPFLPGTGMAPLKKLAEQTAHKNMRR